MTHEQAAQCVALLAAAYPTPAWPDETLDLYALQLCDLDHGAVASAVRRWINTNPDRPTIADVREMTRAELARSGSIPGDLEPDEAWGVVLRAMRRVGHARPFPRHRFPLVGEVVERMGWETLCRSTNPEADRAHFLRIYQAAMLRQREEDRATPGLQITRATPERPALPVRPDRPASVPDVSGLIAQVVQAATTSTAPAKPRGQTTTISPLREEWQRLTAGPEHPEPEVETAADVSRRDALRQQAAELGR